MIDFIKLNVSYLSEKELIQNSCIEWSQETNLKTGEMIYPIRGKYKTLDITINPKRKEISGSLHKFWNAINGKGNQNFDDFSFPDLQMTLNYLQQFLNLEPGISNIENIEYGLNVNIDYSPKTILTRNLIVWSGLTASKNLSFSHKGKFLEFEKARYSFKIYDKGKQAMLNENLIRIEVKAIRNEYLSSFEINTLQDIKETAKLQILFRDLKERFSSCIIVDDLSGERITKPKDRKDFIKGINPLTWSSFDNGPANRKRKERFTKRFNEILEIYQLTTIKNHIIKALHEKGENLLKCHKWNDFKTIPERSIQKNNMKPEPGKMSQSEPYIYLPFVTMDKCIITGLSISHQNTNKTYILKNTIKDLSIKEPETFEELKKRFKPAKWQKITFDELCDEIAHRIRRKFQTLKEKRERYKNSLFPLLFFFIISFLWIRSNS